MNFCNPQSYDYLKPFIWKCVNYTPTYTCTHKDTPTYISLISSCWFTFQLCGLKSILLMSSNKYCSKHPFFFLLFSDGFENRPFTVNIVNRETSRWEYKRKRNSSISFTWRLMMSALQLRISCIMAFFLYSQFSAQDGQ